MPREKDIKRLIKMKMDGVLLPPEDMRIVESYEERQRQVTEREADMKRAMPRHEAYRDRRMNEAEKGRISREKRTKAMEQARKDKAERKLRELNDFLKSPMTDADRAELAGLESMAMDASSQMSRIHALRLGHLREKNANDLAGKEAKSKK